MQQGLHLLSNNSAGVPVDLWVPATRQIPPMQSWVYALGFARDQQPYVLQTGLYYKTFQQVIEFQQGKSFFGDRLSWSDKIEKGGRGRSYGLELLLKKTSGRINGWISYTYSRSLRQFGSLNQGKWYPYRYDRPHNASVFMNYQITPRVMLSANWMFASGDAITLANSQYPILTLDRQPDFTLDYDYFPVQVYGKRNGYRVPATHRLDVNFAFVKEKPKLKRTFKVGVYNLYNRKNPYYVYFNRDSDGQVKLYKASLLPFFPYVAWNLAFL